METSQEVITMIQARADIARAQGGSSGGKKEVIGIWIHFEFEIYSYK